MEYLDKKFKYVQCWEIMKMFENYFSCPLCINT